MPNKPSVVYIINDKLGGILSLNANLIQYRKPDEFSHCAVLLHDTLSQDTRYGGQLAATDSQSDFEYSSHENLYSVLRRLRRLIPSGSGVIVSNNPLELAMLTVHDVGQTVVQIVHDEFNLDLAKAYEPVVDVFVAHSKFYYEKLKTAFPTRLAHIFHLPYGIPLAPTVRQPKPGPLRLIFVGRMTEGKGIFDLPPIDHLLSEAGVQVEWTLVGNGPQRQELQAQWSPSYARFVSPPTNAEVLNLCAQNDVFVLPSRFEGFPVSLLETMSAGLVPVISDLPSGVPEVVSPATGFRPPIGDCQAFANSIIELAHDRERLETMSQSCRDTAASKFDIRERVKDYQALFARYSEFKRPRVKDYALPNRNRLDQPWLPNALVYALRAYPQHLKRH